MFRSLIPSGRRSETSFDDPFRSFQREMNRLLDRTFRGEWYAAGNGAPPLAPSMDVKETDKAIEVQAELPGVDEKDVQVTYENGVLTIKGEKKSEKEETKGDYRVSERSYGAFARSLAVDDVDADKIAARFSKGILKVMLPKLAGSTAKTKTIKIETA